MWSRKPQRAAAKPVPFSGTGGGRASRSAMTTSIRKARRGQMVEMKRHMKLAPSTVGANPYLALDEHVKETISLADSIVAYCRSSLNESHAKLSSSLERLCVLLTPNEFDNSTRIGDTNYRGQCASYDSSLAGIAANRILTHVSQHQPLEHKYLAFHLADALASILNATSTVQLLQIQAAIVLTQLSATEPPPPPLTSYDQEQFSPYGHPSQEMTNVLVSAPTSWCYVVVNSHALEALIQKITFTSSCDVNIAEKCTWAIGNLAGDSEMAREALLNMGVVSKLVRCISYGLTHYSNGMDVDGTFIGFIRNSIWALVNFTREKMINVSELKELDYSSLLLLPTKLTHETKINTDPNKASCHDIVTETCWLLAFFTDVNQRALQTIVQTKWGDSLLSAIVTTLCLATDAICQLFELESAPNYGTKKQLSDVELCLTPLCRILRNTGVEKDCFPPTIHLKQTNLVWPTERCLAKLITLGTLGVGQDVSAISSRAAEAAGESLVNAGLTDSHTNMSSCQILIPALCQALVCPIASFDFKREAAWALWKAVDNPCEDQTDNNAFFLAFQKEMVVEIVNFNSSPTVVLQSLIALLSANDMEATEVSIRLIDKILRRLDFESYGQNLSVMFEEAGLVQSLWRVCDNASEESITAELAAALLDDFYEEDEQDSAELLVPSSAGGTFQFKVSTTTPLGGFDFSTNHSSDVDHQAQGPPIGRGRGRGQQTPAWMQHKK